MHFIINKQTTKYCIFMRVYLWTRPQIEFERKYKLLEYIEKVDYLICRYRKLAGTTAVSVPIGGHYQLLCFS